MADAEIVIRLNGGTEEHGVRRYEPGEEIWGSVQVTPQADVTCRHLFVRLRWRTEGRGDRDEGKIAEQDVYQGSLRANMPGSYDFRFLLPREPWSYAGHYVSIVWEIAVEVDVPWSSDPRHSRPFIMAPSAGQAAPEDDLPRFDLLLVSMGSHILAVPKAIRELRPGLSSTEAGNLAAAAPIPILQWVLREEAEAARAKLEAAGATCEIRPSLFRQAGG